MPRVCVDPEEGKNLNTIYGGIACVVLVVAVMICGCTGQQPAVTPTPTSLTTVPTTETTVPVMGNETIKATETTATETTAATTETAAVNTTGPAAEKDIIETATEAGTFTTLLTAIETAGLTETLKGDGPFTVFAPPDEAFAGLPAGTLDAVLSNETELTRVLTYHVVPGTYTAADLAGTDNLTTLSGATLTVSTDGGVKVDGATVVTADIQAKNGVIHVIDTVMLPP